MNKKKPKRLIFADVGWFALHTAVIYVIVKFCTPWLAGWTQGRLLPFLHHPTSVSSFQFLFSHFLLFSSLPAFIVAMLNVRLRHRAAQFVWVIPTVILVYQLLTFTMSMSVPPHDKFSVLQYFFGGNFAISEFRTWADLRGLLSNSDMRRGMVQLKYTAPLYAGIAYSLGAKLAIIARTSIRTNSMDANGRTAVARES